MALTHWRGGMIAREAKELVVSAWHWDKDSNPGNTVLYSKAIRQAVRVADPFVAFSGRWLVRRLAPDCRRIELGAVPNVKHEFKLLYAMGWETANIHLGTKAARRRVWDDLKQRPNKWLRQAAEAMVRATLADWKHWRNRE